MFATSIWDDHHIIESDHSLISIQIEIGNIKEHQQATIAEIPTNPNLNQQGRLEWKNNSTDIQVWNTLSQQLTVNMEEWNKLYQRLDRPNINIQVMWDEWWEIVRQTADNLLGRRIKTRKKTIRQINDSILRVLIQERNMLKKKRNEETGMERARAHAESIQARKAVKVFLKEQRRKQLDDFHKKLQQLNAKDMSKYWTLLKEWVGLDKKSRIPTEATWEGKKVSGALRLQAWKHAFEKLGKSNMEIKQENFPINEAEENKDVVLDQDITIEEVKQIMRNLARNKASGIDGVTNEILLAGKQQIVQSIWILCRMAWESEKIPEEWAKGLIVPIHKMGTRQYLIIIVALHS